MIWILEVDRYVGERWGGIANMDFTASLQYTKTAIFKSVDFIIKQELVLPNENNSFISYFTEKKEPKT